jgi:hypothetical protein
MEKLRTIDDFHYSTQYGMLGSATAPKEFIFNSFNISEKHGGLANLFVEINMQDGQPLKFGVVSNDMGTKRIAMNSLYFSNGEIESECSRFGLKVVQNPFYPDKLQGSLIHVHADYTSPSLLLREYKSNYFLLIYSSRRSHPARAMSEDFFGDDIYYVHGIWQVELSEEFRKKIRLTENDI